jgi:hypothetical protein
MTTPQQQRLDDVRALALGIMREHLDESWTFRFSRTTRFAGFCDDHPGKHVVALASWNALLSPEYAIRDTMLHEVAHALDRYVKGGAHHGASWMKVAMDLGVQLDLTWDATQIRPWRGYCEVGHLTVLHSLPKLDPGWYRICGCHGCDALIYEWQRHVPTEVFWGTDAEVEERYRRIWPEPAQAA